IPDGDWQWRANPEDSRGGKWWNSPYSGNYDWQDSHWDIDDGQGNRQRYDRWGNPLTTDEAHGYTGPRLPPIVPRLPLLIIIAPCVTMPQLCMGPNRT